MKKFEGIEVVLGNQKFQTKTELENFLGSFLKENDQKSLKNLPIYNILEELVIKYHEDPASKIGNGIEDIIVRKNTGSGYGFAIIQKSGKMSTFSYPKLIRRIGKNGMVNPIPYSKYKKINADDAFRAAVRSQILEFRSKVQLPFYCPIKPEILIDSLEEMDVHHQGIQFYEIVLSFLAQQKKNKEDIELEGSGDTVALKDKKLEKEFFDYHLKVANLLAVSKQGNAEMNALENGEKRK